MQETKEKQQSTLTPRQEQILTAEIRDRKRLPVRVIAKRLGINPATYFRNLKKINVSDWKERQKERLKSLGDLALANIIHNLEKGNYDAGRDWFNKFAHLYTDQLDVVGRMQTMSDDELVIGMKTAILTALQDKAGKGRKSLPKPKESSGEAESNGLEPCEVIEEEKSVEFNGEGLA